MIKKKVLPNEWGIKKLGEVVKVQGGFAFDSKSFLSNGIFQVIKMSNLYGGILDLERSQSFLNQISARESEFLLKENDILITLTGTIGKRDYGYTFQITDEKNLLLNQRVARIVVKSQSVDVKYLFYELKTNRFLNQFFYTARGGTGNQANIGIEDVENIIIHLPPLPEQKAIAACLSTWDEAIQKTSQLITQKELRKKWLMQQLLTRKKRLKGFSGDWAEVKMKDVFEKVTRKNDEGNTNVVTISAQRGFVKQDDFFNRIVASDILDNYFLVEKGEFCYNKSYSNGYPWGATKRLNDFNKAVVTTLYICFRIKYPDEQSGEFFEQYFEANSLDKGLTQIAHEGGRAHGLLNVTPSDFFNLPITIPSFEEQTAIANILKTADKEIELLKSKLWQLKEQKKGLMQMLLTGKKRLKIENQ